MANFPRFLRSKRLRRMLALLLLLFMLPAVAMTALAIKDVRQLRESRLAEYDGQMARAASWVQEQLDLLTQHMVLVEQMRNASASHIKRAPYNMLDAMDLLSAMTQGNGQLRALGIYYHSLGRVILPKTTLPYGDFIAQIDAEGFSFSLMPKAARSFLRARVRVSSIGAGTYFLYCIPSITDYTHRVFLFFLDAGFFADAFDIRLLQYRVLDAYGATLDARIADEALWDQPAAAPGQGSARIDGRRYRTLSAQEPLSGVTFDLWADEALLLSDIQAPQRLLTFVSVLLLLLGLTLIAYALHLTDRPIRSIAAKLPAQSPEASVDDVGHIMREIDNLNALRAHLEADLQDNRTRFLRFQLISLLGDTLRKDTAELERAVRYTAFYQNPAFSVAAIRVFGEAYDREVVEQRIASHDFGPFACISLRPDDLPIHLLLISHASDASGRLAQSLRLLSKRLELTTGLPCCAVLSAPTGSLSRILECHGQALTLALQATEPDGVIFHPTLDFHDFDERTQVLLDDFQKALLSASLPAIVQTVRALSRRVEREDCFEAMGQAVCLRMYGIILASMYTVAEDEDFAALLNLQYNPTIQGRLTKGEQHKYFQRVLQNFEYYFGAARTEPLYTEALLQNIRRFMDENFANPSFTVQLVADTFFMPLTTLSRFFKQHAGVNISEYISKLRIELAKTLLADPEFTLSEIVERVGYYDDSSFIRKFKLMEGITPGQYRKLLQEQVRQAGT